MTGGGGKASGLGVAEARETCPQGVPEWRDRLRDYEDDPAAMDEHAGWHAQHALAEAAQAPAFPELVHEQRPGGMRDVICEGIEQ